MAAARLPETNSINSFCEAKRNTFYKLLTLLKVCAEQEVWGDGNAEGIVMWHCGSGSLLTNCHNATTREQSGVLQNLL